MHPSSADSAWLPRELIGPTRLIVWRGEPVKTLPILREILLIVLSLPLLPIDAVQHNRHQDP